jgi:hypothetical protein
MRCGGPDRAIETTFLELLAAIDAVAETDEEALAVYECMLAEGRVSLVDRAGRARIAGLDYV